MDTKGCRHRSGERGTEVVKRCRGATGRAGMSMKKIGDVRYCGYVGWGGGVKRKWKVGRRRKMREVMG